MAGILAVLFAVLFLITLIWSIIKYEIVFNALIDSFPPQFQDRLNSKYAFPVLALGRSAPLRRQAQYVQASWLACVAILCFSLCFFFTEHPGVGCLVLVVFFVSVFSAVKDWRTYRENCNRVVPDQDNDEP